jgi:hypothetical protein
MKIYRVELDRRSGLSDRSTYEDEGSAFVQKYHCVMVTVWLMASYFCFSWINIHSVQRISVPVSAVSWHIVLHDDWTAAGLWVCSWELKIVSIRKQLLPPVHTKSYFILRACWVRVRQTNIQHCNSRFQLIAWTIVDRVKPRDLYASNLHSHPRCTWLSKTVRR